MLHPTEQSLGMLSAPTSDRSLRAKADSVSGWMVVITLHFVAVAVFILTTLLRGKKLL